MEHSAGFLKIVNEVRPRVAEITLAEARERLGKNPVAILVDVREDAEWNLGYVAGGGAFGQGRFGARYRKNHSRSGHGDHSVLRRGLSFGAGGGHGAAHGLRPGVFAGGKVQGHGRGQLAHGIRQSVWRGFGGQVVQRNDVEGINMDRVALIVNNNYYMLAEGHEVGVRHLTLSCHQKGGRRKG